tara:strand:+ start:778 stop:1044 length:267 start_codon:yes stop_codon:yes gene_type:complete
MKPFILASVLALFAIPAQAGSIILPNLFAREYCSMRDLGVNHDDALKVAVSESIIDGEPIKVTINGQTYDADVIKANRAAMERCPRYF